MPGFAGDSRMPGTEASYIVEGLSHNGFQSRNYLGAGPVGIAIPFLIIASDERPRREAGVSTKKCVPFWRGPFMRIMF